MISFFRSVVHSFPCFALPGRARLGTASQFHPASVTSAPCWPDETMAARTRDGCKRRHQRSGRRLKRYWRFPGTLLRGPTTPFFSQGGGGIFGSSLTETHVAEIFSEIQCVPKSFSPNGSLRFLVRARLWHYAGRCVWTVAIHQRSMAILVGEKF